MNTRALRIATRKSQLALWQATTVQKELQKHNRAVELVPIVTTGDKLQKTQLAAINVPSALGSHTETGKGLFVKEIQECILSDGADLAVHSMKDVPAAQTAQLELSALLPRADARDVLVISPKVMTTLRKQTQKPLKDFSIEEFRNIVFGSFAQPKIGTASARRQFFLTSLFPESVQIEVLRGNIDTRLRRVRDNEFAMIVLAKAGLDRLGLFDDKDMFCFSADSFIPAPAQGAIGVEIRASDSETRALVASFNSSKTVIPVCIERLVLDFLGGDCHMAIAAHVSNRTLRAFWKKDVKEAHLTLKLESEWKDIETCYNQVSYYETFKNLKRSAFAKTLYSCLKSSGFDVVPWSDL